MWVVMKHNKTRKMDRCVSGYLDSCCPFFCDLGGVKTTDPNPLRESGIGLETVQGSLHTHPETGVSYKIITISNQPTVELKNIAVSVLQKLQNDPPDPASTFQAQLAQITLIKTQQLHDYLKVCVLRLDSNVPNHTSTAGNTAATDFLNVVGDPRRDY